MRPGIIIEQCQLSYRESAEQKAQQTNALAFLPAPDQKVLPVLALLTHGYTSHKGSILNWAVRLCEEGVTCLLFDLPGHYLGSFNEVENFEAFKSEAPKLFPQGLELLKQRFLHHFPLYEHYLETDQLKLVLAGHSLGALLSLQALNLPEFKPYKTINVSVGLGMAPEHVVHIFETPFYLSTLQVRGQLVSPAIGPDQVFPWIKQAKLELKLSNQRVHLITGEDDAVVGKDGAEKLMQLLQAQGNNVTLDKPNKLGHHLPENAAPHIKKFLTEAGYLTE